MPRPDGPQFRFHLYHGTSAAKLEDIKKYGLGDNGIASRPFLTHDEELAEHYANHFDDPAIVTVAVRPRDLRVDWNSFDEPVYGYAEGSKKYTFDPDKLRNNTHDWANSLRQTGAVYHEGLINPEHIVSTEKW